MLSTRVGWLAGQSPTSRRTFIWWVGGQASSRALSGRLDSGAAARPSDLVAPDDEHRCGCAQDAAAHRHNGVEQLLLPRLGLCGGEEGGRGWQRETKMSADRLEC